MGVTLPGMAEILCPCGTCGIRFEPIVHGSKQKYATVACGNRMRKRAQRQRDLKKQRRTKALDQRALKFQPVAKPERRVKSRSLAEQGREEELFA